MKGYDFHTSVDPLRIAQRFNAGAFDDKKNKSPRGRKNRVLLAEAIRVFLSSLRDSICLDVKSPALKRWAIVIRFIYELEAGQILGADSYRNHTGGGNARHIRDKRRGYRK